MRKLFLLSISIIILFLLFFITKDSKNSVLNISYDNKPYKIQPNMPTNNNKTTNFAIYDTLNNTKSIIAEKVIVSSEIPLTINKESSIDAIINNLVEEQYSQKYSKIKISVISNVDNAQWLKSPDRQRKINGRWYVLDLGLFFSKQKALEQVKNLIQIYPESDNLYQIEFYNFHQYCLYKLTLKINDFNTAIKICQTFLKHQENCIIIDLKK